MRRATKVGLVSFSLLVQALGQPQMYPGHPRAHPAAPSQVSRRRLQNQGASVDSNAAKIRSKVLADYDKNAFPWESQWDEAEVGEDGTIVRTGVPVEIGINFHKVHEVDVARSTADLVVWLRISWNDPRLVWNPLQYGNLTSVRYWVEHGMGGNEASEIWTPDIYLWNQEAPMSLTLEDTYASVTPDGGVFWSRPGRIKATCKYKGLANFPFDSLECSMELGSWTYSGLYIRPQKMGGDGFTIGGSETAGQSFAEFNLSSVVSREFVYPPFPAAPEEDWPVILYDVTFQRASEPYVRGYVLVQLLLNLAGFCCFWIPPHVGERMGLAITALLAAVASELTVAAKLPAASELNWFIIFSMVSMVFSVAVVFQSTVVLYFYFYTGGDLIPSWARWMTRKSPPKQRAQWKTAVSKELDQTNKVANGQARSNAKLQEVGSRGSFYSDDARSVYEDCQEDKSEECASIDITNLHSSPHGARLSITESALVHMMHNANSIQHDAGDFKDETAKVNNARWQKVATSIDEYSRLLFPTAFAVFVSVIFAKAKS